VTFQHIYRIEIIEEFRLTYMQLQANTESISKSILVEGKIHNYISYEYCQKCHCVYSNKVLNDEE